MRISKLQQGGIACFLALLLVHASEAGNPIIFNEADGRLFSWINHRAVYVVETGRLSKTIDNTQATGVVQDSFKPWQETPTADLQVENLDDVVKRGELPAEALMPFKKDITVEDFTTMVPCEISILNDPPGTQRSRLNCDMVTACVNQDGDNCPSPVVFDEDGSITAAVFGVGTGTIGFSGPVLTLLPTDPTRQGIIVQAFTVINGSFYDEDKPGEDPTGQVFLKSSMVHEFGHFLGLGHSNVNGDTALLNPAPGGITGQPTGTGATFGAVDALSAVNIAEVETMYPFLLTKTDENNKVFSTADTLEQDDQVELSRLYSCTAERMAVSSGPGCKVVSSSTTGTIAGHVFTQEGSQLLPTQGVVVVARRIDDTTSSDTLSPTVLKEAVSQLTGNNFAPRRCQGTVFRDDNNDGVPDNVQEVYTGLFGACTNQGEEGIQECADKLKMFRGVPHGFRGQCGFVSANFTSSRLTGEEAESSFELTGLTPGKYLVQVMPTLVGGFSSPILTGFTNRVSPAIQSNDNSQFAYFPNPQVGEFYNGSATGCGSATASCDQESASASDNPFAYTVIQVEAGKRIENINIFLNTTTQPADVFSNPGFDFCGLGDVDKNGVVDQQDIFAVVRAKAAFEENGFFYSGADLNQDGRITYLDVDIITDLVNIPDPTGVLIASDEDNKRGLAPLGAICQAAIKPQGGCKLQPPFFVRSDNTPSRLVCTVAEGLVSGCENQIVGCETFAPTGCVAIQPPTAVNGALADTDQESLVRVGAFGDCYTFSGAAGQMIDIRAISQEFDTYLFLLGPQGDVIAFNDDCDDSTTNACLLGAQHPLPTDGAYTIEVTSFLGNATGNYTLTVGQ